MPASRPTRPPAAAPRNRAPQRPGGGGGNRFTAPPGIARVKATEPPVVAPINGKILPVLLGIEGQRPFLVYCPASGGRFSPRLFGQNRLFDVAINDYSGKLDQVPAEAEWKFADRDHKWPSVSRNLAKIDRGYQLYAFLDDDLEITTEQLNRLFLIGVRQHLQLFQPALTADSQCSWPLLKQVPWTYLRPTRFVEIMTPFFSAAALQTCWPTFTESQSGYGLDFLWSSLVAEGKAVVDAIAVRHSRPVQSGEWRMANGSTPGEELARLLARFGIRHADFTSGTEAAEGPAGSV